MTELGNGLLRNVRLNFKRAQGTFKAAALRIVREGRELFFQEMIIRLSRSVTSKLGLKVGSGRMLRSLVRSGTKNIILTGNSGASASFRVSLGVTPFVPYVRIHELSGQINRGRPIVPKRAKILHFFTKGGAEVFTGRVENPGFLPARIGFFKTLEKHIDKTTRKLNRKMAQITAAEARKG